MLHTKFQASKPSGSEEEDFWIFSMQFYGLNLGRLTRGHLGPWDLHLNKLGRGSLGNATYQISNIWAKWFWRRRFLNIFLCFLWFEPRTPWRGAILDPGTLVWTNLVKDHRQCYIPNFKHLSQAVLEKKILRYISFLNPRPPRRRAILDPRATIRTNLAEVH